MVSLGTIKMLTESYIKYLLCDVNSLYTYFNRRRRVGLDDIKRNLMLLEREKDAFIPDHYYRLGLEHSFEGVNTLAEVFVEGIFRLADKYLEYHGDKLYVKAELQNEWQLFVPYMPPLVVVAAKIWDRQTPVGINTWDYCHDYISRVLNYTSLLPAYVPELNNFKSKRGGLTDLHIHLNGTIESDIVWLDILKHPVDFYSNLAEAQGNEKVKELYTQVTRFYEPKDFQSLVCAAISLRNKLVELVFGVKTIDEGKNKTTFDSLLDELNDADYSTQEDLLSECLGSAVPDLIKECYLYIRVFDHLAVNRNDDTVAGLFHYYLLIFGLNNMMLVQQPTLFGFDEFQKYTMSGFRSFSEASYNRRFLQLAGNSLDNIRKIEGRFAPKATLVEDINLIEKIDKGFDTFLKRRKTYDLTDEPNLSLVSHFIKIPDSRNDDYVRFSDLRMELRRKTQALCQLRNQGDKYSEFVVGIDAASSEFNTQPEVFAESYKTLRECGYTHFTYHAGEDFFHILSGLRAIYEAIHFLDLRCGDRIGHAVASGVSVDLWRDNMGDKILMRRGEYMDDLIFAYHIISTKSKDNSLVDLLPKVALRIEECASLIYDEYFSVTEHIQAWLMRDKDPETMYEKSSREWNTVEELFVMYNLKPVREKYDAVIEVSTYDIFGEKELTKLQWLMLELMHDKDLVIETLPSSNVLIGHHHDFSTYHLYNWWKWGKEGHAIPPIVVGTDDAGIFATNIYNEYCNIYSLLKYQKHMNTDDIMALIRQIDENSEIYAFDDVFESHRKIRKHENKNE